MAFLEKHSERESWIKWAREFVRRGLWPDKYITVHGPHDYPADHHWGEADCIREGNLDDVFKVSFSSRRPCRKYVVRNVVMWQYDEWGDAAYEPDVRFPLLKASELSMRARRWLRAAQYMLDRYVEERKQSEKFIQEMRKKLRLEKM